MFLTRGRDLTVPDDVKDSVSSDGRRDVYEIFVIAITVGQVISICTDRFFFFITVCIVRSFEHLDRLAVLRRGYRKPS